MLSYLGGAATPTRVRRIAALCVRALGALHLLVALIALALIAADAADAGTPLGYSLRMSSWSNSLGYLVESHAVSLLSALIYGAPGAIQLVVAPSVRRGARLSSMAALITLVPLGIFSMLAAGMMGAASLALLLDRVIADGIPQGAGVYYAALLALATLLATAVTLIIYDTCVYLRWIMRNPLAERPSASFFPVALVTPATKQTPPAAP